MSWPYALAEGDPRHGTRNGYSNCGCRCSECRKAVADARRAYMHRTGRTVPRADYVARVRAEADARDNHGTESRYVRCHCRACRDAAAAGRRRRRADVGAK